MIRKMLTRDMMQWMEEVDSWQDAFYKASEPLIKNGYIDKPYVEQMIESVLKQGPYIVLAEGFALPHAANTGHIHKTGFSLLRVEKPVLLGEDHVTVFVVLASVDSTGHMEALSSLAQILSEEENLKVFTQGSLEEIETLLAKEEVGQ